MIIKNNFNKTKIIFGNNSRSYLGKLIKKMSITKKIINSLVEAF